MKKITLFALVPLIFLIGGCSLIKKQENKDNLISYENSICEVPTELLSGSNEARDFKDNLPPVSQEEQNKIFTYEDSEMGIKLQYPGSCFFNKGVFQCSDFTLSVWPLDGVAKASETPEKISKNGQMEIKYTFINKSRIYALMAWYEGDDNQELNKVIDKIAKSLTFTK